MLSLFGKKGKKYHTKGGEYLKSSRSFERGVFKMFMSCSQGGGGCQKFQKCVHVVFERPQTTKKVFKPLKHVFCLGVYMVIKLGAAAFIHYIIKVFCIG